MDGKVQDINLSTINKTRFWLKNQLNLKGISEFKDVFSVLSIIVAIYSLIGSKNSNSRMIICDAASQAAIAGAEEAASHHRGR